jgi:hypothetical protein
MGVVLDWLRIAAAVGMEHVVDDQAYHVQDHDHEDVLAQDLAAVQSHEVAQNLDRARSQNLQEHLGRAHDHQNLVETQNQLQNLVLVRQNVIHAHDHDRKITLGHGHHDQSLSINQSLAIDLVIVRYRLAKIVNHVQIHQRVMEKDHHQSVITKAWINK